MSVYQVSSATTGSHTPPSLTEDGHITMEAYQKLRLQTQMLQQKLEGVQHLRLENDRLKAALEKATGAAVLPKLARKLFVWYKGILNVVSLHQRQSYRR
jgi:hypothetical protein